MAGLGFMLALFGIFLMIGALLGWVAAFRHSKSDKAIHRLELACHKGRETLHDVLARPERFELPTTWFEARTSFATARGRTE